MWCYGLEGGIGSLEGGGRSLASPLYDLLLIFSVAVIELESRIYTNNRDRSVAEIWGRNVGRADNRSLLAYAFC
jgi:hypothetical protein